MRKIRYAVMGLGHIAQVAVLPAFKNARANSELAALISGDPKKLRALGKKYKVPESAQFSYDDFPDCLADANIGALYICLPNHLHASYAIEAMENKIHVLCEKPLATSLEDCDNIVQAARDHRVKFMTAYRLHFEESNLAALKIAQKQIGDLRMFSSVFSFQIKDPDNIRLSPTHLGGGPMWDIGVYCLNAVRGFFKDEPIEVFAMVESNSEARFSQTNEMMSVTLRFPKNRVANFCCSFGADSCATVDLVGSKGRIHLEKAFDYATSREMWTLKDEKPSKKIFKKSDQFAAELLYFSKCILRNVEPEPSAEEGRADVRVIEAILKSAATGLPVKLGSEHRVTYPKPQQLIQRPGINKPKTLRVQSPSA